MLVEDEWRKYQKGNIIYDMARERIKEECVVFFEKDCKCKFKRGDDNEQHTNTSE